eukprot:392143-Amphidinium_carterae.2
MTPLAWKVLDIHIAIYWGWVSLIQFCTFFCGTRGGSSCIGCEETLVVDQMDMCQLVMNRHRSLSNTARETPLFNTSANSSCPGICVTDTLD